MAEYIVNFLLIIPGWFIIDYQLTSIELGTGENSGLLKGFTTHCWVFSNELSVAVHRQLRVKIEND